MKFLIVVIFAVIAGAVVWRSKRNTDPAEQACAREIGALLKSNPDAEPRSIASIFVRHEIAQSRCRSVARMVMPQLRKNGLNPEDSKIAMNQVRAAFAFVPDEMNK